MLVYVHCNVTIYTYTADEHGTYVHNKDFVLHCNNIYDSN